MMKVIKAETQKDVVIHTLDDETQLSYTAIRGSLSWPQLSENVPAYYCIVGEEFIPRPLYEGQVRARGRLRLIAEYAASDIYLSLSGFFSRLTDDTKLLLCRDLYGVTETYQGEQYEGYVEALQKYAHENKVSLSIYEAPWAEKPDIGILHIMNWQKQGLLDIPSDSILYQQMKQLRPEDLKRPEGLNAINAFRFVVSAFEKQKPGGLSGFVPDRSRVY
jgi:hypothetical protein